MNGLTISIVSNDFQTMFHGILNGMTLHGNVCQDFITVYLQDVVKIFPDVLTTESFFFTEYQSLHVTC